jgi:hypothetical protein
MLSRSENYRNSLTYIFDHQLYISLIVPLLKELSTIFYAVSKAYFAIKESQNDEKVGFIEPVW